MFDAFTWFTAILALAWLGLFISKRELRTEMLLVSTCAFFLAPVIVTVKGGDPNLVAERFSGLQFLDLIFSFTVAGLAATFFHGIFGKHYHRLPKSRRRVAEPGALVQIWLIRLFVGTLLFLWGIVFCVFAFDLTPAPAALATAIVMAVYIVVHRHDLIVDTLLSAALMGVIAYISAAIALFLTPEDFGTLLVAGSGRIGNVPTDLVTWSIAFGLALGPLYEYVRRLTVK